MQAKTSKRLVQPALIGAGVIIVEIISDRLIAITTGYVSIFLSVSIALTGIGAGYAYGIRLFSSGDFSRHMPKTATAVFYSGIAVCLCYCAMPIGESLPWILLRISMFCFATVSLFVFNMCAGMILYLLYSEKNTNPSFILFSDLIGSLVGLVLLLYIGNFFSYNSMIIIGVALVLYASLYRGAVLKTKWIVLAFLCLAIAGLPLDSLKPVPVGDRRGYHERLNGAGSKVRHESLWSDVTAVGPEGTLKGMLFFDGGNHSSYVHSVDTTQYDPKNINLSCPDQLLGACLGLRPIKRALVIGSAGGVEILCLYKAGARRIDAVNQDRLVLETMTGKFGQNYSRAYSIPGVRAILAEGRRFIRKNPLMYDIIVVREANPDAGAFGPAAALGIHTVATMEGVSDLLAGLREGGLLIIETDLGAFWYHLFSGHLGPSWHRHVISLSNGWSMAHIVNPKPFSLKELSHLDKRLAATKNIWKICCEQREDYPLFMREILDNGGVMGYKTPTDMQPYYFLLRPWWSRGFSLEGAPKRISADPVTGWRFSPIHLALIVFSLLIPLIGFIFFRLNQRRSSHGQLQLFPILFAFTGGLGFSVYEISLIRVGYQMVTSPMNAWIVGLLACLSGASLAAIYAPKIKKQLTFSFMIALASILLGAMFFLLPYGLRNFPMCPGYLSDTLLFFLFLPLSFALAMPLSLLAAYQKDRKLALPASFIANAWGALLSPFLSLLIDTAFGHGYVIIFLLFVLLALLFQRMMISDTTF